MKCVLIALTVVIGATLHAWPASAQVSTGAAEKFDSTAIDLEDLDKIDVRSASLREQQIFRVAAAVYTITGDDIRRSGARSLAEALRMAPGLDVAQLDGTAWSVSARGSSGRAHNHMLLLIDGRTIYSPTFQGIRWEMESFPLDDIVRIEVLRGPGAMSYGANAVNGVINILTKTAQSTEGWLVSAASGNPAEGSGTLRYARKTGTNKNLRLWATYDTRPGGGDTALPANQSQMASAGLRADLRLTPRTDLEIDALIGHGLLGRTHARAGKAFLLGRWEFDPTGNSARSEIVVQAFVDANRHQVLSLDSDHDVYESEFRYRLPAGRRQEITWGGGHRTMVARRGEGGSPSVAQRVNLSNVSLQDVVSIIPTKLTVTAGARLAHHSAAGWLFDPDMRWAWSRTARQTLWASLSRASTPPSLADDFENADVTSLWHTDEHLFTGRVTALESGYRLEPIRNVMVDTAIFLNAYRDTHMVTATSGRTYGIETLLKWTPTAVWGVDGWYSAIRARRSASEAILVSGSRLNSPTHQWQVRSRLNVRHTELDATFGVSGDIPQAGVRTYRRLDIRIGRKVAKGLELSLAGQNLLGSSDFRPPLVAAARYFPRHAGLKATWQF
jgi:iron complex outermembrane recepter protein